MDLQFLYQELCESKKELKEKYGILEPLHGNIYAFSTKINNAKSKYERSNGSWGLVDIVKDEVLLPCEYKMLTFGQGDKQNSPSTVNFNNQEIVKVRGNNIENYYNLDTRSWCFPSKFSSMHVVKGSNKYFVVQDDKRNYLLWEHVTDKIIWDFKVNSIGYDSSYKIFNIDSQELFYTNYSDSSILINLTNKKILLTHEDKTVLDWNSGRSYEDSSIVYKNERYLKLSTKGYVNIKDGKIIPISAYKIVSVGHTIYSQQSDTIVDYETNKTWKTPKIGDSVISDLRSGFTDSYNDFLIIGDWNNCYLYKVTPSSLMPIISIHWNKELKSTKEAIVYVFGDYLEDLNQ